MFKKLCENLNLLMTKGKVNADELGRRTGLPPSTIKKIRNCDNPNPTLTTLQPLAKYFSITLSQLVGDDPLPPSYIPGSYRENPETLSYLPLLPWNEVVESPNTRDQPHDSVPTEYQYSQNAYALAVEEDDWENLVKGTIMIVDPSLTPIHRDFVIIHKKSQPIPTLKQILYDDGEIYLKPIVNGFNVTAITPDQVILGVVVEYKKYLKRDLRERNKKFTAELRKMYE